MLAKRMSVLGTNAVLLTLLMYGGGLCLLPGIASGAPGDSVKVTFTFDPRDVHLGRSEGFDTVQLKDGMMPEDVPGTPWLPARVVNVMVPAGAFVTGVTTANVTEERIAGGLNLLPVQPPVPASGRRGKFVGPNPAAYGKSKKHPAAVAQQQLSHRMRGWTFVSVRVNPLRYVASTGELYLVRRVTVQVRYAMPGPRAVAHARNRGAFRRMVGAMVVNAELPGAEPDTQADASQDGSSSPQGGTAAAGLCDYLVITSTGLKPSFQDLAAHRGAHDGLSSEVVDLDWIAATYDGTRPDGGTDLQTKIRNCIIDYVQNKGTLYVVLGGDNSVVPDRDCYVSVGSYTAGDMPTDLYYAGLDGTWDDLDGDGVYGEADASGTSDEGDLAADVFVGRIPVRTATQAADYIGKVIAYDNDPSAPLAEKFFLGGDLLWDSYSGAARPTDTMDDGHLQFAEHDPVSDAEIWGRRFYRDRLQAYEWNADPLVLFMDTLTSWDSAGAENAGDYLQSSANMKTRLSEGWNFAVFNTHGNYTIWGLESGYFYASDAMALTGHTRFVYTIACMTGGFDQADPCLSEGFLRCANGGALVYMGCSRYGWGSPGSTYGGTSFNYLREFFRQVFSLNKLDVSEAFFAHKAYYAGSSGSNGSYRWVQFGLNLQGDPALHMRTAGGSTVDAVDDEAGVDEDSAVVIDVLANDSGPAGLSIQSFPQGSRGVVSDNGDNTLTYTPYANENGVDTFTYTADDGAGATDSATVTVTIAPINDAPVFTADPIVEADATAGQPYSGTIADDADDVEGDALSFSKLSGAAWLTVADSGLLSGTPGAADEGLNSFAVVADDLNGGTATATLQIAVAPYPPPGPATSPSPADGATGVGPSTALAWTAGAGATSHDVYFGATPVPAFQGSQSGTTFDPGGLAEGAIYYWRIDEVNPGGTTTGSVWSFTTGAVDTEPPVLHVPGDVVITLDDSTDPSFTGQATAEDNADPNPVVTYSDSANGAPPDPYAITRTWTATDSSGNSASGDQTITVIKVVDQFASAETTSQGTLSGSYLDTRASDDVYEALTERATKGKPANRRSVLDHEWTLQVEGGDFVMLYVEGYHTANTENDDFAFAYSTDGVNYTEMFTLTQTVDDGTALTYELPPTATGTVYVAVVDTDGTKGNSAADTLYVDLLLVQTEAWPAGSMPPGPASDPSPADGAVDVATNAVLSWAPGVNADSSDVYFGTSPVPGAGDYRGNQTATLFDPGLMAYLTTYYWRIDEVNTVGMATGTVWSFTTQRDPDDIPPDMHVENIVAGVSPAGKKVKGQVTVTILDDSLNPVEGATVSGTFTGDYSETRSGVTGADGIAVITTARGKRAPVSFTFTVDNVTGPILYDPADNVMTSVTY